MSIHSAQLVHITPNAEDLIAYMARVSNPNNQDNTETSTRLIKYLITHKHWSPFEMVNMCVEINTTRAIAAQILRHRSFSFQEFSQRYAEPNLPFAIPEFRSQDSKNRQNSIDDLSLDVKQQATELTVLALANAIDAYLGLIELGVAKECARDVLPLCTPSRLYMNGSIRSWLHYVDLRTANGTQLEHQIIARNIKNILFAHLPNVSQAMWPSDSSPSN